MNMTDIVSTREAEKGFYPTPSSIAGKMLKDLDWRTIQTVLEPSAGKGDLITWAMRHYMDNSGRYRYNLDVDCCEIDPYLRQILKYNFSKERLYELYDKRPERHYRSGNAALEAEIDSIEKCDLHIVHDDFLTYRSYKHYDLILMNPPFADGDKHLLRAIDFQKHGGNIICLLNAETIRNPFTATRRELMRKLNELNAEISFVEDAFSDAERSADVDVAIIRIAIPNAEYESTIYSRMKEAEEAEHIPDPEMKALVAGDYIEQAIQLYNTEVAASLELVREYRALSPYIQRDLTSDDKHNSPILTLTVGTDTYVHGFNEQKYMKAVRMKYWDALFRNEKFTRQLTSELREKYREQVDRMADYEFSAFNIKQVMVEMNAEIISGVEKAILDLFEKLTVEHSWYPECSQNRHYYNGWKTNKAHKIGKKCIIPTYGMFSQYSSRDTFDVSTAYKVISDLEKAFSYLDADRECDTELNSRLQIANSNGQTRNICCKYFSIDLYKKGTTHIKFHPESMKLVERLNIYASQKRGWLPPNYGRTAYSGMDAEEKSVIDAFHGDGASGSGADKYTEIMANASFYLAEPTQNAPLLTAGGGTDYE